MLGWLLGRGLAHLVVVFWRAWIAVVVIFACVVWGAVGVVRLVMVARLGWRKAFFCQAARG